MPTRAKPAVEAQRLLDVVGVLREFLSTQVRRMEVGDVANAASAGRNQARLDARAPAGDSPVARHTSTPPDGIRGS
jgi:hypothetical protein